MDKNRGLFLVIASIRQNAKQSTVWERSRTVDCFAYVSAMTDSGNKSCLSVGRYANRNTKDAKSKGCINHQKFFKDFSVYDLRIF